jgi:hypothetical protein
MWLLFITVFWDKQIYRSCGSPVIIVPPTLSDITEDLRDAITSLVREIANEYINMLHLLHRKFLLVVISGMVVTAVVLSRAQISAIMKLNRAIIVTAS